MKGRKRGGGGRKEKEILSKKALKSMSLPVGFNLGNPVLEQSMIVGSRQKLLAENYDEISDKIFRLLRRCIQKIFVLAFLKRSTHVF